jgi:histidyl-tRNA synthetase
VFGLKDVSGVGISFGADRIYDVLNTLEKYPDDSIVGTQLLFINFGKAEELFCLPAMVALRAKGVAVEIYPDSAKMKKQMDYANKRNIPFVAIVGETEMQKQVVSLKNMITGEQQEVPVGELFAHLPH